LHIKGRRNIRVQEVPLDPAALNSGDVFVLDAGREVFQWNGSEASRIEKAKGLDVTKQIRDQERSGNANIHIIEEGRDSDALFWEKFGKPKPKKIKTAAEGGDDDAHARKLDGQTKLYRISDAGGKLKIEEVAGRPLTREMLDTNDAYILDTASLGSIYAWIGKGASNEEKLHSWKEAQEFIKAKGYPNHTQVTRVVEGGETPLFKQNFQSWPEKDASKPGARTSTDKPKFIKRTFSSSSMHTIVARDKIPMPDDGKGELQMWRVEKFELVEVPKSQYGHFYGGDSYVMMYTYLKNDKKMYIVYFWQGLKSSQDEKGASALWAVKKDEEVGGEAVQVRVVQNKEPPHFYLIFKGRMVIHEGGRASGFKNINDVDRADTDGTRLFQIRGTTDFNTRAIQVPEKAASLNSGDTFILESPKKVWLWFGAGCSGDEREMAKNISKAISNREYEILMEGKETADFWAALGGKASYANSKAAIEDATRDPRLFQCSNARGYFYVEEIFDFDQEDLIEEDVMLLDTYYEIYVWIGKGAKPEEKKDALKTAMEYIQTDPSGRTVDGTVMMQLKQGFEPPNFTCHFHAWDPEKWSKGKSYDELKQEIAAGNAGDAAGPVAISAALDKITTAKYSYEILTGATLPEGVDANNKEAYLNDADFHKYFGCSRSEYNGMPKWKQSNLKKKARLY